MPDIIKVQAVPISTTQCGVCGTVLPPPIASMHATGTTTPPIASMHATVTTTPLAIGPGKEFVQAPSMAGDDSDATTTDQLHHQIPLIAGLAGGGAIAIGGLVAGIVAINRDHAQVKEQYSTPVATVAPVSVSNSNRFLAPRTHQSALHSKASAPTPSKQQPGDAATKFKGSNVRTPARLVEEAKFTPNQIAADFAADTGKGGITTVMVIGCFVLAVLLFTVGLGLFTLARSSSRSNQVLHEHDDEAGDDVASDEDDDDDAEVE